MIALDSMGRPRWSSTVGPRLTTALLLAMVCGGTAARGEEADASIDGGAQEPPTVDPRTPQIRDLMAGTLDPAVDPRALFEVAIDDEEALGLEAVRVRTLLRAVDESARPAPPPRARRQAAPTEDAARAIRADISTVEPKRWEARVALDRARLEFYALAREQREALLHAHSVRREASRPKETEDERLAREAETERQRALEAARAARSEAERLVVEDGARLATIERSLATARERFRARGDELASRKDALLGWQRRARDARASTSAEVDATYDALRRALRGSRDELGRALDELDSSSSEVPVLGPDPLTLREIPPDILADETRARRATVENQLREARREELSSQELRASALLDEIDSLNRERLGLLPDLSPDKRSAITGFTEAGFDQARSEARHLLLVLRYHRHVAAGWFRALRHREGLGGLALWQVLAVAVPWVLTAFAFSWWRRRSPALLRLAEDRVAQADRAARRAAWSPSRRAVGVLVGVHRSLEWLLFFGILAWLLPRGASELLEVQLLSLVVGWSLAGSLIVNVINTLASVTKAARTRSADELARLRLRSIRLVGRVVVGFALTLLVFARLVGEGTVFSWVSATSWLAAVAVFLILVLWWREAVFKRVDRMRRKSRLHTWVLANQGGWKSFLAAMIGAVQLFTLGSVKVVGNWLGGSNVARRAHAYLFKRELDRLTGEKPKVASRPLDSHTLDALSPDRLTDAWVKCPVDAHVESLLRRAKERRGGVVAVIGGRGQGKSSLLRRLQAQVAGATVVGCEADTAVAAIQVALDRPRGGEAPKGAGLPLVMLDDADAIVKPVLHGLRVFDEVLAFARSRSRQTPWVFAIDAVVWPFLRRARDARPMFDEVIVLEPWSDEHIGELLYRRTEEVGLTPIFDDLLEKLPVTADETDRSEALDARRAGYFRMIWDYARGNPAMALEVWRSSLVEDGAGTARVLPLQAPDPAPLEALPDSMLFILRAVLQLNPAPVADVAQATRLTEEQVENAFRFGWAHGYLSEHGGRAKVAWAWNRSVLLLLERRHLLVNP